MMNNELKIFRVGFANQDVPLFVKADDSRHALEIAKHLTSLDACVASQIPVYVHDQEYDQKYSEQDVSA